MRKRNENFSEKCQSENKQSFLLPTTLLLQRMRLILTFALSLALITQAQVSATSYCSNSFRFDQLCPDPRIGSRGHVSLGSASSSSHFLDTIIPLNGNGSSSSRGAGATSVKDATTTSCDFHRNGMETAIVTAVHMTENPWSFRHANTCNQIFKLDHGGYSDSNAGGYHGRSGERSGGNGSGSGRGQVCEKETGIRRFGANDKSASHEDISDEVELVKKVHVYFWHNFTLLPHSAEFVDTIMNYHLSTEDIACSTGNSAQYVQIAVTISKSNRCEILVQQYKIEHGRSPYGCTGISSPIPYPIQFCGSYECSQMNNVLIGLKLLSRRKADFGSHHNRQWNNYPTGGGTGSNNRKVGASRNKDGPGSSSYNSNSKYNSKAHIKQGPGDIDKYKATSFTYSKEPSSYEDKEEDDELPPCVTTTPSPENSADEDSEEVADEEQEEIAEPIDWQETIFISTFPICGIVLIIVILNILRSKSGQEICRGYPYPRNGIYQPGSCNSIDKNVLPM